MSIRNNIDHPHSECYAPTIDLASKVVVTERKKRTCDRQTRRSNVAADLP